MQKLLTIRQCAKATGVTPDTLRYYEKIGLLARVPRERNGHRRFGSAEIGWVTFLRRLHDTGMPIRRMQQYARLLRRGDETIPERRALLEEHREDVRTKMTALAEHLRMIEKKIETYGSATPTSAGAGTKSAPSSKSYRTKVTARASDHARKDSTPPAGG